MALVIVVMALCEQYDSCSGLYFRVLNIQRKASLLARFAGFSARKELSNWIVVPMLLWVTFLVGDDYLAFILAILQEYLLGRYTLDPSDATSNTSPVLTFSISPVRVIFHSWLSSPVFLLQVSAVLL